MILIKHAHVYAPQDLGVQDVLVDSQKIVMIAPEIHLSQAQIPELIILDATDQIMTPGLIDNHVHLLGGGGEAGFTSRVEQAEVSEFIANGITTVIGLLGTDGITRNPKDLLAKVNALNEQGITAFMHTGSYGFPSVTVSGSVSDDITYIDRIIGVKIALADHRSSFVQQDELLRLASQARVAGMISGKAGVVLAHMGDASIGLDQVIRAVEEYDLPAKTIHPTHVNRNRRLLEQSFAYAKMGGIIDFTAFDSEQEHVSGALARAKEAGVPLHHITISSDAHGSTTTYDSQGNVTGFGVLPLDKLLASLRYLILEDHLPISEALTYFTSNVAEAFSLKGKGYIKPGYDADLLLLDEQLKITTVIAKAKQR